MEEFKNISQHDQELFEKFLLDQMSNSEKDSFKAKLDSDPDLKESFKEFKTIFRAVEEAGLRTTLDKYHTEIEDNGPGTRTLKPVARRYRLFVAASIAFLILMAGYKFIIRPNSNKNLFAKYFAVDPGLPTVMGENGNYDFYKAMVAYKQGKYDIAIKEWELQLLKKPDNDTLNYFLGSAYLAKHNVVKAIPFLEKVIKDKNSFFYDDSQFYLGLIFIKEKQIQKAKTHLELSRNEKSRHVLKQLENK